MTVDTPFPSRPGTPFWDPRGRFGMSGLGDEYQTARWINAVTSGALATEGALMTQGCPYGMLYNPATYSCQLGVTGTATGNAGMWVLLAVGVGIFLFSRGR